MDGLKKKVISVNIDAEVWEDWKEFSGSVGLSASAAFELVARAIMGVQGSGGFTALLSFAGEVGKQAGEEYKKGIKKGAKGKKVK